MPWIIDGNNLARGGDRESVRRAALAVARRERVRLVVFFDGRPPAGGEPVERLGPVEVRYVANADAAIIAHLGAGATGWIVATDDRALADRARSLGARAVAAAEFRVKAERAAAASPASAPTTTDLSAEVAYFRDPANRLPGPRAAVQRRKRGRPGR
jgi:hypothetical protein